MRLQRFLQAIDATNRWAGRLVAYLLVVLMVVIVYEVVARYAFKAPTKWGFETSQFLLCAVAALGGGYTLLNQGHVNVDVVYQRLRPRTRAVLSLLTGLLFLAFIIIFLRQTGEMALDSVKMLEHTESPWRPPVYPVKMAIFVGGLLIFLQAVAKLIRDLIAARGKKEDSGVLKGELQ